MGAHRNRARTFALALMTALVATSCASSSDQLRSETVEIGTAELGAAAPDALLLSESPGGEVERFLSEATQALSDGTISFDAHFSRRCNQLEGVHSPVDPLMAELDRFYTTMLSDHFQLPEATTISVVDATPEAATVNVTRDDGDTNSLELAFQSGAWRFDSCDVLDTYDHRKSLLADGTPVVTVESGTLVPVDRANAMIDSWAAGHSSYYPWLSMRCRAEFTAQFSPSIAFDLMTANGPDGFTAKDAQTAAATGEVLDSLAKDRENLLLPLLLQLKLGSAGADAVTEDEVTVWVTVGDDQEEFTTRWVEEAGNLYNDECNWIGADDVLDGDFDPSAEIQLVLSELSAEVESNQLNVFDRFTSRCRAMENLTDPEDPRLSTLSLGYADKLRATGLVPPFASTIVSADEDRVVVQLGSEPTDDSVIAFAFEGGEWRVDSCADG